MNLARKYEHQFASGNINLDTVAAEKDQNWQEEKTAWIFEDGSALTISGGDVEVVDDYGLHVDHEQLR